MENFFEIRAFQKLLGYSKLERFVDILKIENLWHLRQIQTSEFKGFTNVRNIWLSDFQIGDVPTILLCKEKIE